MSSPSDHAEDIHASARRVTGWHVFLWMSLFFGFMFLVNGIFIWKAVTTFPGEERKQAYLMGLDYNSRLEARDRQAGQGWRAAIGMDVRGQIQRIALECMDAQGQALPVKQVELILRRHAGGEDVRTWTSESVSDGAVYFEASDLTSGRWQAEAKITLSAPYDDAVYYAEKALVIR